MKNQNVLRILVMVLAIALMLTIASCEIGKPKETTPEAAAPQESTPQETTAPDAPHEHVFDAGTVTKEATCTEKGEKTFKCECGETKTEELEALGHNADGVIAAKAPTCTEAGVVGGTYCTACNEGKAAAEAVIEPLAHNADGKVDAKAPTCTETGVVGGTYCTACNTGKAEAEATIPALGHKDEDGDYKCDVCGNDLCTEHVEEILPAQSATCTEAGLTEGKKCSVCGEILVKQEVVDALGHNADGKVDAKAPTCTEAGVVGGTYCTVCEDGKAAAEATIDATGHNAEGKVDAKEATCTEAGVVGGTYCTVCDEGKADAEKVIPALGHDIQNVDRKDPTCTEAGLTTGKFCARCGVVFIEQKEIPATGHDYKEEVTTAPTCTTKGEKTLTCLACGDTKTEEIDVVDHTPEEIPAVDPTCTTAGSTAGEKCSVCDATLVEPKEVAALGHTFGDVTETVAPTCAEAGKGTHTCSVCGETEEVAIPALPHTMTGDTCTVCGYVCTTHSYETNLLNNPSRFEKTWGVCTICGYIDDDHTHKIEAGKCVYCDYEFSTSDVTSAFDADGDGAPDVYKFSAALPEKFNDAIRLDAFKDSTGNHMEYDEIRAGSATQMPYPHAYCSDGVATDALNFTVTVDKAGIYEVAVHIRLKDQKERGATFVINEGTANEQSIKATYGWATADEATMVRDSDYLQSAYYTGLSFILQEGENTISIRVADNASKKSQHFRDLYLVWSADLPECETHSYETDLLNNPSRFEKTWGVCTVCGYIADDHTHKIEAGKCVYCDYEFSTSDVTSAFDADGDGAPDVYKFSAALPEKFNDAIRLDAFKDSTGNHMEYDEIRAGSATQMPYPHAYCSDGVATDALNFTVTVDKAGIYEVAVHIRLKDQKERGATFVINEGTAFEQSIKATYGWATADEATMVRDSDYLQSAYYTGLRFELQAGENTISIKVADNASKKSQHFRDLYLVLLEEFDCDQHALNADNKCEICGKSFNLTAEEAIAMGITYEKSAYSEEFYYVTLTLNTQVNANGFARATLEGEDMIISVAGGYLTGDAEGSIAVGDTVTFLAQVGCVNSASTASTKEARLFNVTVVEIVKAPEA